MLRAVSGAVDKVVNIFGKWGSSAPVDDSFSGITIGDKTYQVVVSLNGCYYYIDEDGKKKPVAGLPDGSYEWVNIAEKVLKDFRTCYRTLGGTVEVWSWYLLNDELEVLKETHRITDSTDVDNPVGTELEEIPSGWVMVDCDLPDMTERDVTLIDRCYETPGGKVEVEGLEAIDDKLVTRESKYVIIQGTDEDFPAGYEFGTIPSDWVRIVCDFPDMTQRTVVKFNECYSVDGVKVRVEGYRSIDPVLGIRNEWYYVMETTDGGAVATGTIYTALPDGWERIVCDFADQTTADTETVENCYTTGGGKVQVRTYLTLDGNGRMRGSWHTVLRTTDASYAVGDTVDGTPDGWAAAECDFASLEQRHAIPFEVCYSTGGGKVHVRGMHVIDNFLNEDSWNCLVLESTDGAYAVGTRLSSLPDGWEEVVCDFADRTTADIEVLEDCFTTDGGDVTIRSIVVHDADGEPRTAKMRVSGTSDDAYPVGTEITEIPEGWTRIECSSYKTLSYLSECYEGDDGKIYVEGYRITGSTGNVYKENLNVVESTVDSIEVGTVLTGVPLGMTKTECLCTATRCEVCGD